MMPWQDRVEHFLDINDFAHDEDWRETEDLLAVLAAHRRQHPREGFPRHTFDRVVRWKLRDQIHRDAEHLANLNDGMIYEVTRAAIRLEHPDPEVLARVRTQVLCGLPGVGFGVASAILTVYFPESYGIIDFRCWDEVHERDPALPPITRSFGIGNYLTYLAMIRPFAAQLGRNAQLIDYALWRIWGQRRGIG